MRRTFLLCIASVLFYAIFRLVSEYWSPTESEDRLRRLSELLRDGNEEMNGRGIWAMPRLYIRPADDVTPLVQLIKASRDLPGENQVVAIAAAGRVTGENQKEELIAALRSVKDDGNLPEVFVAALSALAQLGAIPKEQAAKDIAGRFFENALKSRTEISAIEDKEEKQERSYPIIALGGSCVPHLIKLGDIKSAVDVHVATARASLGRYRVIPDMPTSAIPFFVAIAEDPQDEGRRFAVRAIGDFGNAAQPTAQAMLRLIAQASDRSAESPDREAHRFLTECIDTFGEIGADATQARTLLKPLLNRGPLANVTAAEVLARVNDASGLPILRRSLRNSEHFPTVAICVLGTIGHLGNSAVPAIPDAVRLSQCANPDIRKASRLALMRIGDAGIDTLLDEFESCTQERRREILKSLSLMARFPVRGRDRLYSMRDRCTPQICATMLLTLVKTDSLPDDYGATLNEVLQSDATAAKQMALYTLTQLDTAPPEVHSTISRLLIDPNEGTRSLAVDALHTLEQDSLQFLPVLKYFIDNDTDIFANSSLRELGQMPSSAESVDLLVKGLTGNAGPDRINAALSLGMLGEAAIPAFDSLTRCLEDEEPLVRLRAAVAIYQITGNAKPALSISRDIINTPTIDGILFDATLHSAFKAVESMGVAASGAIPDLRRLLEDDDSGVRVFAADLIRKIDPTLTRSMTERICAEFRSGDPVGRASVFEVWAEHEDWTQSVRHVVILGMEDSNVDIQEAAYKAHQKNLLNSSAPGRGGADFGQ